MPNNGRNQHHRDDSGSSYQPNFRNSDEHGYQDPRDQRDRENGRDDFRGLDRERQFRGASQGADQYAERDRMYSGERENMNYRGQSGSQSGGGYGNENWRGQGMREQRGPHAGKGPQGFQRSDERIKELVHEALTDHEHIDATHITVDVKNGEVTLGGTVDDRQTKRTAEDAVERVSGVKDVQNQIRTKRAADTSEPMGDRKTRPS